MKMKKKTLQTAAYKRVNTVRACTIMAWPARWRSPQRDKHKSHPHTASLSLIIHYTRRNAHAGDETIKKGVVAESLALKYRHIFKNGQQKTFSPKRPSKNGQKKPNGQPNNLAANQPEIRPNFWNLAAKRPIWQPCLRVVNEWPWIASIVTCESSERTCGLRLFVFDIHLIKSQGYIADERYV